MNVVVTVGGVAQSIAFPAGDALTLASSIAAAINAEHGVVTRVVSVGGASTVGATPDSIFIDATAATSVTALGGVSVIGGSGGISFTGAANTTDIIAFAGGSNTVNTGAGSSATVVAGAGSNSVTLGGSGSVETAAGSSTIAASGGASTSAVIRVSGTGDMITIGDGSATVGTAGSGAVVQAGDGPLVVRDTGSADSVASQGSTTIYAGAKGAYYLFGTGATGLIYSDTVAGASDTIFSTGTAATVYGGTADMVGNGNGSLTYFATGAASITGGTGSVTVMGAPNANVLYTPATVPSGLGGALPLGAVSLIAGAGSETFSDANSSSGSLFIGGAGTASLVGGSGADTFRSGTGNNTIKGGSGASQIVFTQGAAGGHDVVQNLTGADSVVLSGYPVRELAAVLYNQSNTGGQTEVTLSDGTVIDFVGVSYLVAASANSFTSACYCRGTLIATPSGDVPIEALQAGQEIVTAAGERRAIRWVGHTRVDCRGQADPGTVWPVRVRSGAFGAGLPATELWLSPGHAVGLDVFGPILVRIGDLVNGATVVQEAADSVEYWHVELDSHDLLVANGMPAESFIDVGNRGFFEDGTGGPDGLAASPDEYCHPLILDEPALSVLRARLLVRAADQGWRVEQAPVTLQLMVDGVIVTPEVEQGRARFLVPAGAAEMWLRSPCFVPQHVGAGADPRRLGVAVQAIQLDNGLSFRRVVRPDDPALRVGFHVPVEDGSHVWTTGAALLPPELWAGCSGAFFLTVAFEHRHGCPTWQKLACPPVGAAAPTPLRLARLA